MTFTIKAMDVHWVASVTFSNAYMLNLENDQNVVDIQSLQAEVSCFVNLQAYNLQLYRKKYINLQSIWKKYSLKYCLF